MNGKQKNYLKYWRQTMKTDEIKEILYLEKYIDKYKSDEKAIINGNRLTTPAMLDYLEVKE